MRQTFTLTTSTSAGTGYTVESNNGEGYRDVAVTIDAGGARSLMPEELREMYELARYLRDYER